MTIKLREPDTLQHDEAPTALERLGAGRLVGVDVVQFKVSPSYPTFQVSDEGEVIGPSGRQLKHFPNKNGYRRVNIYLGANRWKQVSVHTLACEAFHGPRPDGMVVAHCDGDPGNNRASNLRWETYRGNEADKVGHGTRAWCERHGMHKLTADEVREIRSLHDGRRFGYQATADKYGVTIQTICSIVIGKSWRGLK